MRKIFLTALVAFIAIGCSEDPLGEIDNPAITYDPSKVMTFTTDPATRGTPVNDVSGMTDMGVFSSYTGLTDWDESADAPGKMFDQRLERNGSVWIYDGTAQKWNTGVGTSVNDRYTFFAYAPFATGVYDDTTNDEGNGIEITSANSDAGYPVLRYTVPTDVTKQPDLMVAVPAENIRPLTSAVHLQMEHALTCVGFQLVGTGQKITSISVTGVSMEGTMSMDGGLLLANPYANPWTLEPPVDNVDFTASINFDSGEDYYTATSTLSTNLMKGDGYLMMLPQDLGSDAKVILTQDGNAPDIEISLDTHEWEAGKRVTYEVTLTPDGVTMLLVEDAPTSFTFTGGSQTFKITSTFTPYGGIAEAIAWKMEFSDDDGDTWTASKPSWLTIPESGVGGTETEYSSAVSPFPASTTNPEDLALLAATPKGTEAAPYDLSKRETSEMNTANCYIVNAPGWYKLPLVYGNAIVADVANTSAYIANATTASNRYLTQFVRHDDQPITDPYIKGNGLTPVDAVLVWMDSPNLITSVDLTSDTDYLSFHIMEETVGQGNAIVAVRDANKDIMWSWHIWVTPTAIVNADNPDTEEAKNYQGVKYNFMKYYLGWCTAKTVTYGTQSRSIKVRVSQTGSENTDEPKFFTVAQTPGDIIVPGGNAPYWQFGRKDPMLPSDGSTSNTDKPFFGDFSYQGSGSGVAASLGFSIKTPYIFYAGVNHNWTLSPYRNLWSALNTEADDPDPDIPTYGNDNAVVKTVYDPSPVGFTMPSSNAWTWIVNNGHNSSGGNNLHPDTDISAGEWYFYLYSQNDSDYADYGYAYYPAMGYRVGGWSGGLFAIKTAGFIYSATPESDTSSGGMTFRSATYVYAHSGGDLTNGKPIRCVTE